jgi:hypothetical protein
MFAGVAVTFRLYWAKLKSVLGRGDVGHDDHGVHDVHDDPDDA